MITLNDITNPKIEKIVDFLLENGAFDENEYTDFYINGLHIQVQITSNLDHIAVWDITNKRMIFVLRCNDYSTYHIHQPNLSAIEYACKKIDSLME